MRFYLIFYIAFYSLLFSQSENELVILNRMIERSFYPIQDFLLSASIESIKTRFVSTDENISPLIKASILSKFEESSVSDITLEVVVRKSEIRYPEIVSFPLFGEENLKRVIELDLAYLVIKDEKTIFQHNFYETYVDTISISELNDYQKFQRKKANIPEVGFWRRAVEPTIITSITGAIVYLFFSVRSR